MTGPDSSSYGLSRHLLAVGRRAPRPPGCSPSPPALPTQPRSARRTSGLDCSRAAPRLPAGTAARYSPRTPPHVESTPRIARLTSPRVGRRPARSDATGGRTGREGAPMPAHSASQGTTRCPLPRQVTSRNDQRNDQSRTVPVESTRTVAAPEAESGSRHIPRTTRSNNRVRSTAAGSPLHPFLVTLHDRRYDRFPTSGTLRKGSGR